MNERTAIVTGSVQGIGKGIALRLAKAGYSVAVLARSSKRYDEGAEVAAQCSELSGRRSICVTGDISDKETCKRITVEIADTLGTPDILVNCAGIVKYGPVDKIAEERYKEVISNNLDSAYFMIQSVVPYMKKQKYGRIISISSLATRSGSRGMTAYTASKAAVEAVTRSAALELAPYGITVNCILPGYVRTSWLDMLTEEQKKAELERIPMGRFAETEDIANLAAFLASDEASYITSQSIAVAGGMLG